MKYLVLQGVVLYAFYVVSAPFTAWSVWHGYVSFFLPLAIYELVSLTGKYLFYYEMLKFTKKDEAEVVAIGPKAFAKSEGLKEWSAGIFSYLYYIISILELVFCAMMIVMSINRNTAALFINFQIPLLLFITIVFAITTRNEFALKLQLIIHGTVICFGSMIVYKNYYEEMILPIGNVNKIYFSYQTTN